MDYLKPNQFLDRRRAAQVLTEAGVRSTPATLGWQAHMGTGPRFALINGRALYRPEDIDAWLAERVAASG